MLGEKTLTVAWLGWDRWIGMACDNKPNIAGCWWWQSIYVAGGQEKSHAIKQFGKSAGNQSGLKHILIYEVFIQLQIPFAVVTLGRHKKDRLFYGHSHCEGSQKCIFHALYASTIPLSDHFVTEQQQTVRKSWGF